MKTKRCSRCKETLLVSAFHQDNRRGDGLNQNCKNCVAEKHRERCKLAEHPLAHVDYLMRVKLA
jgi:hypothetical protein